MFNRFLFILYNILMIAVVCILTILELIINLIPFVLFESYILDAASDIMDDIERLKKWLFGYE